MAPSGARPGSARAHLPFEDRHPARGALGQRVQLRLEPRQRAVQQEVVGVEEEDELRGHVAQPEVPGGAAAEALRAGNHGHVLDRWQRSRRGIVDDYDSGFARLGADARDGVLQELHIRLVPRRDHDGRAGLALARLRGSRAARAPRRIAGQLGEVTGILAVEPGVCFEPISWGRALPRRCRGRTRPRNATPA